MEKKLTKKRKDHGFRKDVYLLGKDSDGIRYWLEAPSWDCGWYWGFGYVETYKRNAAPAKAHDIDSHSHIDSSFMGQMEVYDFEKRCHVKGKYIHNIYDCPTLSETTFTEKEGWELSELFKQFYLLREMADFSHKEKPGCHVTTSPVDHGDMTEWNKHINTVMMPKIFAAIIGILSPAEEVSK
jgi:hypothetical protein